MPKKILGQGKYMRLVEDGGWEYYERLNASGVVVLVAVTPDRQLVLVEQFRKPLKKRVLELPAGLVGDLPGQENEPMELAAGRELEEETGYRASLLQRLAMGPNSSGSSDLQITFYWAWNLRKVGQGGGDASEDIVTHTAPLDEIESFIAQKQEEGLLIDPKIYAGLWFAQGKLKEL